MKHGYLKINIRFIQFVCFCVAVCMTVPVKAQHSVARKWNEALLTCIRKDLARPTIHARNIFHISAAMYDAWAAFDSTASPYLLGKTVGNYTCNYSGILPPVDKVAAQDEAISYAAYRVIRSRFQNSPGAEISLPPLDSMMTSLGYSTSFMSQDYSTGSPAALGNYIAASYISYGFTDGSNQQGNYANQYYAPVNPPFYANHAGDSNLVDPNRWQQIFLDQYIDQSGNVYNISPPFLSAEWGNVHPFALNDSHKTTYNRNSNDYQVYLDPGAPPLLDTNDLAGLTSEYKKGYLMVSIWQSHHDTTDQVMWDISPASLGNIQLYPTTYSADSNFYDFIEGGDIGQGRTLNPKTGLPYEPNIVKRGDYVRVLAEFWADGPNSETPPGHWFSILNYVNDHPDFEKRWGGQGDTLNELDWNIRSYFTLAGAMHDAAVSAWSAKGWYDSPRPVSIIRWMCGKGQCSDPQLPFYHPAGTPLISGYVEQVLPGDSLAGPNNEHLYKIKLFTWKGHDFIADPLVDMAGAGWILAENWWPYQRSSFVTPPFAGFVSGHSTFSRSAAELMTLMTGDPFFPGGMCEFHAEQNTFLHFEEGPSSDITIQWATYQDASDQCSLSRIWGGIHPPQDDLPGRNMGMFIGPNAFQFAEGLINAGLPFVQSVTIDQDIVSDQLAESFVNIIITYNEDMDQLSQPEIEFLNPASSASLTSSGINWSSARTCQISFFVSDLDTTILNIGVKVSGGLDLTANEQKIHFQNDLFNIDTQNPSLVNNTVSNSMINMSLVGNGTFQVEVTYDEPMNSSLNPSIIISPAPVAAALAFNPSLSLWLNDTTFLASYNVIGNIGEPGSISFSFALGQDEAGNIQFSGESNTAAFVDTRQPSVSIITSNAYELTPQEVGPEALKFISIFDEGMDESSIPIFTFPGNTAAESLLTFNEDASYWINQQTYLASFDLGFQSIDVLNIPVYISGAIDLQGNTQFASNNNDYFDLHLDTNSIGFNDIPTQLEVKMTYPNPVLAGDELFIRIQGNLEKLKMNLYAMNGQLIRTELLNPVANGLYSISTFNLSSGLYFVQLRDSKKTATFKVQVTD